MYFTKLLAGNKLIKWSFEVLLMVDQFIYIQVEIEAHENVDEDWT